MNGLSPLPLAVIGGYLGAGKTTLINHLLRHAEGWRLSVLVNDFGAIAIDADLLVARDGDSMTLANGCVCCSIGGDLYRALTRALERRPRADALVIEASGVAEPARIAAIAKAEPDLRLAGIAVLADASTWLARAADPLVGGLVARQVAAAGLVILNKTDLVPEAALSAIEKDFRNLAPRATVLRAVRSAVPPVQILEMAGGTGPPAGLEPEVGGHSHEDDFRRWSLSGEYNLSRAALGAFIANLPGGVHRLKGYVTFESGEGPFLVQVEGDRTRLEAAPSGTPRAPACRLVAIGPRGAFDPEDMDALAASYFRSR